MNVRPVMDALESIAPLRYAEAWDNVGLLVGSPKWNADSILLTIDLTEDVLAEALKLGVQMIVAYHPPIFEPMKTLTDANVKQHIVLEAARAGISIYSPHTALDAAPAGLNDWLAAGFGQGDVRALQAHRTLPESEECKIVTFCPAAAVDSIRKSLSTVGAGRIGEYQLCSFELRGHGTFLGGEKTNPAIGQRHMLERVEEVRLEMVCSRAALGLAMIALREFHPYEEPAIEIHPLEPKPERMIGQGRRIRLDQKIDVPTIIERMKQRLGIARLRLAAGRGAPKQFTTIGLCAGAGGALLDDAIRQECELFFTGEMKHHDIVAANERGCTVLLAGHTNTERPYLAVLKQRLEQMLPEAKITLAQSDRDPLVAF
ncbi:MAG TPA: Nif3-like dinuclear metal center hexameric protein [Phycisphaerales bacterium]|nr:Nif3-like dinuclear metal center hexameric protein [Phycisphaerales bacterium]